MAVLPESSLHASRGCFGEIDSLPQDIDAVPFAISRNLCDTRGLGKLNTEQFALAMYLIQQKVKGIEPPQTLPPDMVPPSMRQVRSQLSVFSCGSHAAPTLVFSDLSSALPVLPQVFKDDENTNNRQCNSDINNFVFIALIFGLVNFYLGCLSQSTINPATAK